MSLFNQDLLCPLLFQLTLLIPVVSSYFRVILLNFHCVIFLFQFFSISSISMSVSHLFVQICLAWSANLCSVTGKTPISSHIFFILCLYFNFVGSLFIQQSITLLFTAFSHFMLFFVWSVAWWWPVEAGSGPPCMLAQHLHNQ